MSTGGPPFPKRGLHPDDISALISSARRADSPRESARDLLVYVHVPYCSSKCHFCDFVADVSVPDLISGALVRGRYVAALCRQIEEYGPRLTALGYRPRLVYWGGGTPTRLSAEELTAITGTLAAAFDLGAVQEYSVESSPETLTVEKVQALRNGGATRISTGVQSFDNAELRRAGRAHSADQAEAAAHMVREGGIDDFNIDLIAGFPGQTMEGLRHSIKRCISLAPTHVTLYPYRADARTVMARQIGRGTRPVLPLPHLLEAFEGCRALLAEAGYEEYAVGHFARSGHRFLGESYYFDLGGELAGDFFGFGSGAGSTIGHHALSNPHSTMHRYYDDPLTMECAEQFSPSNLGLLGKTLRLALLNWSGVDARRFADIFGFPLADLMALPIFQDYLAYFRSLGAEIIEDENGIRVSRETQAGAHMRSYAEAQEYIHAPENTVALSGPVAPGPLT